MPKYVHLLDHIAVKLLGRFVCADQFKLGVVGLSSDARKIFRKHVGVVVEYVVLINVKSYFGNSDVTHTLMIVILPTTCFFVSGF